MSHTGLSLDPDFTMKAVKGMLTEMRERPHVFKGHRILFIHTGENYIAAVSWATTIISTTKSKENPIATL